MTDTEEKIQAEFCKSLFLLGKGADKNQLYKAIEALGGQSDILGIIGSYKDTLEDDEILSMIMSYNEYLANELLR